MDDIAYNIDKVAIFEQQAARASEALVDIEQRSEGAPVAFLKANYENRKIRERRNDIDFKMMLGLALTKICGFAAIKSEVSDFDSGDIQKMILSTYADLSLEEIYKAFELERYGVYEVKTDHYNLFNAEYVAAILKKYRKWKTDTKHHHNISPKQELPEMTESQKMELVNQGIIRAFSEFRDSGVLSDPCAHIFDELYERKIIKDATGPKSQQYYQDKYDQARSEIEAELKLENVSSTGHLRTIREELEKIAQNNSDKVVVRSKKLILADYFRKLVAEGTEIEKIILP